MHVLRIVIVVRGFNRGQSRWVKFGGDMARVGKGRLLTEARWLDGERTRSLLGGVSWGCQIEKA
jgi:hypothetical protein